MPAPVPAESSTNGSILETQDETTRHLSLEEEEALVDALILDGWEQGCWLDETVAKHSLNAEQQRTLFEVTAQRPGVHRELALAGQGHEIPETLPQDSKELPDVLWLVVTQRCDLIKGLRHEPTVALIRTTKWTAQAAKDKTRRSPYLYTVRQHDGSAWVADFRETIVVPKAVLTKYRARQCLDDGTAVRRRFALAYAQRTWRRPVPTDIQQKVQQPLQEMRKRWRETFYRYISDILVEIEERTGKYIVYAVIGDGEDYGGESPEDLEVLVARFFDETVLEYLSTKSGDMISQEKSVVIPAEQLTMTQVFNTYKLDLNYMSSDEGGASPQI